MEPRTISSHSPRLNHMIYHAAWLLNRVFRHTNGKTSCKRNWPRLYNVGMLVMPASYTPHGGTCMLEGSLCNNATKMKTGTAIHN
eukprot:4825267-Amphidinium_carterae.1